MTEKVIRRRILLAAVTFAVVAFVPILAMLFVVSAGQLHTVSRNPLALLAAVLLLLGLSYGIYRKSRACAVASFVLMCCYVLIGCLSIVVGAPLVPMLILLTPTVGIAVVQFLGARACYAHHKRTAPIGDTDPHP